MAERRARQAEDDASKLRSDLRQLETVETELRSQLRKAKSEAEEVSSDRKLCIVLCFFFVFLSNSCFFLNMINVFIVVLCSIIAEALLRTSGLDSI